MTLPRNQPRGGEPLVMQAHSANQTWQDIFLITSSLAGFKPLRNPVGFDTVSLCLDRYSSCSVYYLKYVLAQHIKCLFFLIFRSNGEEYSIEFYFPYLCLLSSTHTKKKSLKDYFSISYLCPW